MSQADWAQASERTNSSKSHFLIVHPSFLPGTPQFSNWIINFGSLCAQSLAKNNANLLPSSFDIMRLRFNTKGVAQIGFWLISIKIQLFSIPNNSVSLVWYFFICISLNEQISLTFPACFWTAVIFFQFQF